MLREVGTAIYLGSLKSELKNYRLITKLSVNIRFIDMSDWDSYESYPFHIFHPLFARRVWNGANRMEPMNC